VLRYPTRAPSEPSPLTPSRSRSLPRCRRLVHDCFMSKRPAGGSAEEISDPQAAAAFKRAKMATPMEIDEDLHSRQLAVYGRESMQRMSQATVLVVGLKGLGVEVAKNVILAGVKAVTVYDPSPVELADLGAQFYLTPADVGKNRAAACKDKLQDLNPAVVVSAAGGSLTDALLGAHSAVVCTDMLLSEAQRVNEFCHAQSPAIPFIKADVNGVFASVFCDFGPSFTVLDVDGEEPHTGIIASISAGNPTLVTCVDDERLQFDAGDMVVFSEVEGMTQLNDGKPRRVKTCKPHHFELEEDSTQFGEFARGGIVTQFKPSKSLTFKTLAEALANPGEFLLSDFSKMERSPILHVAYQALDAFRVKKGRMPTPGSVEEAAEMLDMAKAINDAAKDKVELDEAVILKLAHTACAVINPMAAMFGGMVGQEVVKAVSGKFHPLHQWFYFDSVESMPAEFPLPASELELKGTRYDHQIICFGKSIQQKLSDLQLFLVGAGALGCEFLKNFALMGACTSGKLTVTDDDVIEKSNLSRQFLFRDKDIGSAKSSCASAAAVAINPELKVNALQNRVSPDTEDVFDDGFWTGTDLVVNALDNVNARLYVDSRCVYFCKPLLESGTLGAKCNTQVVIPHMTENYGASRDPPEKSAPMCTVHSFPHNIDHCLTWARSEFEGILEKAPAEANSYLQDPEKYSASMRQAGDGQARDQLEKVVSSLQRRPTSFEDCIEYARTQFQSYFHDKIKQLTFIFPEDAVTSTGSPFWSAPKRFPTAVVWAPTDQYSALLVQSLAILTAETYCVDIPPWGKDAAKVAEAAAKVTVPEFVPKKDVKIETDPKATGAATRNDPVSDDTAIDELLGKLDALRSDLPPGFKMAPVSFEKDDDTNFHMDLITSLANMRARNYKVPEVDKLKAKLIAGRIIPAIATATAMATGLVCLEVYKVLQGKKEDDYRNTFANLALPLFAQSEPIAPKKFKFNDMEWSMWDRWILKGDLTVQEVLDWFTARKLTAYSISCGASLLYNNIFPKHKERLGKKMSELVGTVAKQEIPAYRKHFDVVVACEDDEGEDLDVPLVSIEFR